MDCPPWSSDRVSDWDLGLVSLAGLARQQAPGICCFCLADTGINLHYYTPWVLGIDLRSWSLHGKYYTDLSSGSFLFFFFPFFNT